MPPPLTAITVVDEGGARSRDAAVLAERLEAADVIVGLLERCGRGPAQLVRHARGPVAFAPEGYADAAPDQLRVLAVGFDGQVESRAALRLAERVALAHASTLRVYAAVPQSDWSASGIDPTPDQYRMAVRASLDAHLHEEVESLSSRVRAAATAVRGDPVRVLADASRAGADLLVVGSHGRGRVGRVLLGSVSSELLERAECPVLVVPALEPAQAAA